MTNPESHNGSNSNDFDKWEQEVAHPIDLSTEHDPDRLETIKGVDINQRVEASTNRIAAFVGSETRAMDDEITANISVLETPTPVEGRRTLPTPESTEARDNMTAKFIALAEKDKGYANVLNELHYNAVNELNRRDAENSGEPYQKKPVKSLPPNGHMAETIVQAFPHPRDLLKDFASGETYDNYAGWFKEKNLTPSESKDEWQAHQKQKSEMADKLAEVVYGDRYKAYKESLEKPEKASDSLPDQPELTDAARLQLMRKNSASLIAQLENAGEQSPSPNTNQPNASETSEPDDRLQSKSARRLDWVAEKLNNGANRVDSLVNKIEDAGGLREYAAQTLRAFGRGALGTAWANGASTESSLVLKNTGDLSPAPTQENNLQSSERQNRIRSFLKSLKERAESRMVIRQAEKTAKKAGKQFEKQQKANQKTAAAQVSAYDTYSDNISRTKTADYDSDYVGRVEQATADYEAAQHEAKLDARRKALLASLRKQARRKFVKDKSELLGNKVKDTAELSKDKAASLGRALTSYARNSGNYVAGAAKAIHQAGVENVRAANIVREAEAIVSEAAEKTPDTGNDEKTE